MNVERKWGALAASAIVVLALCPQLYLFYHLGAKWSGGYAYFDTDEVAYSAYLQALIDGRPRRCNPYTGVDQGLAKSLPESLFSIQFIPAYTAAFLAKFLGLSASSLFIALMPLVGASSALVLFWFLVKVSNDRRFACVGVLAILCLPTLVAGQGPIRVLVGSAHGWSYLTFLRRYLPAMPFPFFLLFFGLVWCSLTAKNWRYAVTSIGAGATIALLIFSYFYLWTAALAWLICVTILWMIGRPSDRRRCVYTFFIIGGTAVLALIPYLTLLSQRSQDTDSITVLMRTRGLDLFRPSELLSITLLAILARLLLLGRLSLKNPEVLFSISLLLTPLAVFNQQVLTGRSLQPFHYEEFVTTYTFLMAAVICWRLLVVARLLPKWTMSPRILIWVALFSFVYGATNALAISSDALDDNVVRDQSIPVAERLEELAQGNPGVVLSLNPRQGDTLPTLAPVRLLWAAHMAVFPGTTSAELKERFYQYLYYSDITSLKLHDLLSERNYMALSALFGYEREAEHLTAEFRPVKAEEIDSEVQLYDSYVRSFNRDAAARYELGYVVISSNSSISNLDRWYQRDSGEKVGDFTIHQLKLRPLNKLFGACGPSDPE